MPPSKEMAARIYTTPDALEKEAAAVKGGGGGGVGGRSGGAHSGTACEEEVCETEEGICIHFQDTVGVGVGVGVGLGLLSSRERGPMPDGI